MILSLKRLIAYWIDFVFLATVLVGLQWLLSGIASGFPFRFFDKGYEIEIWVLFTFSLPVWAYFIWCETHKRQTIGKRWLRLIVTNREGSKISFWQALFRTFIRLLPWELTHLIILVPDPWWAAEQAGNRPWIYIPNLLIVIYVAVLFANKGKRGVHDYMAKTTVKPL